MVQKKNDKIHEITSRPAAVGRLVTLMMSVVILMTSFLFLPESLAFGVTKDSSVVTRLLYPLIHASPIHAFVNVWCLICVVFIYEISIWRLVAVYCVSVIVPGVCLSEIPTVGLSCTCYCLLGSISLAVKRKLYFQSCMFLWIAAGFLFTSVNALIHVYGYCTGIVIGLLDYPIDRQMLFPSHESRDK